LNPTTLGVGGPAPVASIQTRPSEICAAPLAAANCSWNVCAGPLPLLGDTLTGAGTAIGVTLAVSQSKEGQ
jgi:hypothetical protein